MVDDAGDARQALLIVERARLDLIDLGLPVMDGFDFIKQIRKMSRLASIPALALTRAFMDKDIQHALADTLLI